MKVPHLSAAAVTLFISTFLLLVALPVAVRAQMAAKSPLEGVWRIVERTNTSPTAASGMGKHTNPGPGLIIFTGKHFSQVLDQMDVDKPRPNIPDLATATADQLRAALVPLVAQAGTYEMSQGTVTLRNVVNKIHPASGTAVFATWSYQMEGKDTLVLVQMSNQAGPITTPTTLKFSRVE